MEFKENLLYCNKHAADDVGVIVNIDIDNKNNADPVGVDGDPYPNALLSPTIVIRCNKPIVSYDIIAAQVGTVFACYDSKDFMNDSKFQGFILKKLNKNESFI